ncbi:MAG TPA: DmsC/YnfH family molybdoenzyme membrane anchor subunit [Anaerolineales bacterium]|nr:DmsC/YnfH family molybdoenzyme membrane anchor subunit [Anaerolineales bacterium]
MTYAFTFDARFCSGCKACQAACKDKNNLPTGVLWRKVIEVSGGSWQQSGEAWTNSVFAYNLSIACNHCVHPKCAGICPANAYIVREDGIVLLDETKCTGCGYCAWACPYGAPQYNPDAGHMTKCNFCFDQIDQGLPPSCVAACPLRVLDYRGTDSATISPPTEIRLWDVPSEMHPYPLPGYSHTQPRLAIKPHAAMNRSEEKYVANLEEIQPRLHSQWDDLPLVLFTILLQMAVGSYWAMTWMADTSSSLILPSLLIGLLLGTGMLASLAHLGRKTRALNMLRNVRRSSLSKEILFVGLFGLGYLITTLAAVLLQRITFEAMAVTCILGIGLIYNMSQVYRFPAAPGWNTWRTNAGFMVSTLLLGLSIMTPIMMYSSNLSGLQATSNPWMIGSSILVLLLMQVSLMNKPVAPSPLHRIRIGMILAGVTASSRWMLEAASLWSAILVLLIVLIEEALGRWQFYKSRI